MKRAKKLKLLREIVNNYKIILRVKAVNQRDTTLYSKLATIRIYTAFKERPFKRLAGYYKRSKR